MNVAGAALCWITGGLCQSSEVVELSFIKGVRTPRFGALRSNTAVIEPPLRLSSVWF